MGINVENESNDELGPEKSLIKLESLTFLKKDQEWVWEFLLQKIS